jgi:predicted aspartyl protease
MNSIRFFAAALPLLLAAPAAAAPMAVLPTGHPVAEVRIDGHGPYRFVIDTAATNTSVLPRLRAALPDLLKTDGRQDLSGAAGATTIETLTLGRLDVDGRSVSGLKAFSIPPSPVDALEVDGVLGADVIADYAVEMDMKGKSWRMADTVTPAMTQGMHAPVPLTLDDGRAPRLTAIVDGVAIPALLDTGARATIMNWQAARLLGLDPASAGLEAGGTLQGVTEHGTKSLSKVFAELRLGEAKTAAPKIRIADLPVFEVLGMADGPAMIVGIDMLADRRFVIDHPGLRLFISEDAAD